MLVSKNKIGNSKLNKELSKEVFNSNKRLFLADRKQWLDLVNSSKEVMDIDIALADSKVMYMISKYKVALISGLIDLDSGDYKKNYIQTLTVEKENIKRNLKVISFPTEKENKVLLKNITFKRNSIQINKIFVNDLKKLVQFMKENKSSTLKLIGHSDKTAKSTEKYNQELARKRVENVANWLLSSGIEKSRILVESKGFEIQVATNDLDLGNELNRRVEFLMSKKGNN